jgi:hypothetical protein
LRSWEAWNVRLRDYGGAEGAGTRSRVDGQRGRALTIKVAAAAAAAVILIGGGAALAFKSSSAAVPVESKSLCPTRQPPSEIDVLLLDVSDRFSEPQRLQLQNLLGRFRDSIHRFGLIEVYTVDRLSRRVTEPVAHLCNPGTGEDLNKVYQNPELARKKWQGFATRLNADIERQIALPAMQSSPIFEAIQATALRTFGKPVYDGLPKRLVIVSDLMQNVPGALSMYQAVPSFKSFEETPYYSRVRSDLGGVSVLLYYLARPTVKQQNQQHLAFWRDYLQAQGAELEGVEKIFGDR